MKNPPLKSHYECLIVGAGIVGAGSFRDLTSHGIETLMIDQNDFCSQTSAASSKMLHGGIRYLENMDFSLVHEALHEKNLWLRQAPHLAHEKSFYLPVYKNSLRPLWMIRCGLWLYDFLSGFQNSPHSIKNKTQVSAHLPGINGNNLTGAGVYFDSVVDDVKLGLELIYDALTHKHAHARSYCQLENIKKISSELIEVKLKDVLTRQEFDVTCKEIILTMGPFTDKVLGQIPSIKWAPKIAPSKGSHLWLKKDKFNFDDAVVLTPPDGRVIFVIPYHDKVLLGTTEVPLKNNEVAFNMEIAQSETSYLLANINEFFPDLGIDESDILSSFAGIRPLVKEDGAGHLGKIARVHKYFQPCSNVHIMIGGKYTTFRKMAMDVVQVILNKRQMNYDESLSMATPKQTSVFLPFESQAITHEMVLQSARTEYVRTFDDLVIRRMGIKSRAHWKHQQDFDEFFNEIKSELENYLE